MLELDQWPRLRDPVLVLALTGWVDAGSAGAGAANAVVAALEPARRFATIDLADVADLRATRPFARLHDGVTRSIEWPRLDLHAGRAGRDVVVVVGPEPCIRWQAVADELVNVASQIDARLVVTLGGMPAAVSHRRPVPVLATATTRSLAQEVGALRADYHGPTGLQTVVQVAMGEIGVPGVGLWAQVPHYVAANPSPPAVRALLERLREVAGIEVDLRDLDAQCDDYAARVEEGLDERPDVAAMVTAIEEEADEELPSGDDLAREIERFLRGDGTEG